MESNKKPDEKEAKMEKNRLDASLSLSNVKISISSDNPHKALPELRKLVEAIGSIDADQNLYEDVLNFDLKEKLSVEVTENEEIMSIIKNTLSLEEDYMITKGVLKVVDELDLVEKKQELSVDKKQVSNCTNDLFAAVEVPAVRSAIVHLKGAIGKSARLMILDNINKHLNYPKIKIMNTQTKSDDRVLVEVILFGDFQYNERQDY